MNKDESAHFRRGQVFGFTIAEIITLLLFVLLLALMTKIVNINKEKEKALDKADFTQKNYDDFIKNLYKDIGKKDVFIIKEELIKQQNQLKEDQLRFKELERILLASGEEIFEAKNDTEKIKKMREALSLGGAMIEAGFNKDTSVEEIETLANLQKALNDPKNEDKPLLELLQKELEKQKIINKNKTAYADARIKQMGKNALVPCWVDSGEYDLARRGMPISLYTFHVEQNGFRVEKAYKTLNDKMYSEIVRAHEVHVGNVYRYSANGYRSFKKDFAALKKDRMMEATGTKCVFTVDIKLQKWKGFGNNYLNSVATGVRIFEKTPRIKKIWGFK